jgi:hypothetical protein
VKVTANPGSGGRGSPLPAYSLIPAPGHPVAPRALLPRSPGRGPGPSPIVVLAHRDVG